LVIFAQNLIGMKKVAAQKKQKNISEYIIYMYQMEDLLRAYQFNLADINQYVVAHYPISEDEKSQTLNWFSDLYQQMKEENILNSGHLMEVQKEVNCLANLHWSSLKNDASYFEIYHKAKPFVVQFFLEAGSNAPVHEIQICFNTIYGFLLAKLNGRSIPDDISQAADAFGDVLSYLNSIYHQQLQNKIRSN
jgi:hypothetical protein